MPEPKRRNIEVDLEDWVQAIVRETAREAVREHRSACPIEAAARDLWGNGKPGLKADVAALQRDVQDLSRCKRGIARFLLDLAKPLLAALITAAAVWFWAQSQSRAPAAYELPRTQPTTQGARP